MSDAAIFGFAVGWTTCAFWMGFLAPMIVAKADRRRARKIGGDTDE